MLFLLFFVDVSIIDRYIRAITIFNLFKSEYCSIELTSASDSHELAPAHLLARELKKGIFIYITRIFRPNMVIKQ